MGTSPKRDETVKANAEVEPRRDSDVGSDLLLDALDDFGKRGGRMVFWTCPKGCRDIVDWNHDGGKSVPTCRKCGASNSVICLKNEAYQRTANSATSPKEPK